VIISQGRGYVFVHIPKTGGTALTLALEARAMKDDVMIGDTPKARKRRRKLDRSRAKGRLWKHSTLADIDGLYSVDEIASLFAFTLVRNPWDRLVSYYHWLQHQQFDHPAVHRSKTVDFDAFILDPNTQDSLLNHPYAHYMTRADGVEHCASYIRLEHLSEDIADVEAHLGFALDIPLVNQSQRNRDYRPYYTDETALVVSQLCAADIERFGYRFG